MASALPEEVEMIGRGSPLLLTTLCFIAPPAARADEPFQKVVTVEGVTEYRLPNGLRVLLIPDQSKPIITINMTVLVGSRHEGYGETGMAHLLEHMLFKGTPTHRDVNKALRDHGAGNRFNGTTNYDRTNYYETMPASDENLEFGIKLEADRLVNSFVKREDLVSEMTVVRNEFEERENSPSAILAQRMMATAFEWHNYGKHFMGSQSDIERVPIENLQAFYKKYYRPDNVILIVAGQFDEKKALEYVTRYFGPLKRPGPALSHPYTEEPAQDGERRVALRRVGSVGVASVMYHIPAATHADFPAVSILATCLAREPGGRVYKSLVEGKKASGVGGSAAGLHDPGVIEVAASVEDPIAVDAVRDALVETIEGLARNPITDDEVAVAKKGYAVIAEKVIANSQGFAQTLGEWSAVGDWRMFFVHRDRLEKVTAADVNRVAAQYLVRSNRTVGTYYPTKQPERAHVPQTPDAAKIVEGYQGRAAVADGETFDPTPENIEKRVRRGELGGIKTAFLPKKTRGDLVTLRLTLRYGNEKSLNGQVWAAKLLPDMLIRGTKRHTRQQFNDEFVKLGAAAGFSGQEGVLTVTLQAPRANLAAALKLVGEGLRESTFPEAEFTLLKNETLEALAARKTDPTSLALNRVQRKLSDYAKDDIRYVPTIEESIERVKATTLDQVKAVYEQQLGVEVGELVAVGAFDPDVVMAELGPVLVGWKAMVPYLRWESPVKPTGPGETIVIDTPDKANAVYVAGLTFPLTDADPEYPALLLGNYLLGEAQLSNRLIDRVRREQGLSYSIGSEFLVDSQDKAAAIVVVGITNPANMRKVDALVAEEVKRFLKDGVTADELSAGKKARLDERKVSRASDGNLIATLAHGLFVGRTFAYDADLDRRIEALTPADIRQAFAKFLDPKKLVVAHAGDFKKK
jgi:zinc protease